MHLRVLIVVAACVVFACSNRDEKRVTTQGVPAAAFSPCDSAPLADLIQRHPIHVLIGAADFVPGATVICDSTLGEFWATFEPEYLPRQTTPAKVASGVEHLCAILERLPRDQQSEAVAGIASWVDTWAAIDQAEYAAPSVEYFASAVVRVPEVRAAVPEDVIARAPDQMAGDTMASTQFTEMHYALAHILSRMPKAERDRVLEEIRILASELLSHEQ